MVLQAVDQTDRNSLFIFSKTYIWKVALSSGKHNVASFSGLALQQRD
jgi:hypothetical protein